MTQLTILTWNVHEGYLHSLDQVGYRLLVPYTTPSKYPNIKPSRWYRWKNVVGVPVSKVKKEEFDLILFQVGENIWKSQYEILRPGQLNLPKLFLEHNPPQTVSFLHPAAFTRTPIVFVTRYNSLSWNIGKCKSFVIEHGIPDPKVEYQGTKERGVVVVNEMDSRGKAVGRDIWMQIRNKVPIDLVGSGNEKIGGIGVVNPPNFFQVLSEYRFFFNPTIQTSLQLSMVQALSIGMPVLTLATTEHATVLKDGESGFVSNDLDYLIARMRELLANKRLAAKIGSRGKDIYLQRFNIERFCKDWRMVINKVMNLKR